MLGPQTSHRRYLSSADFDLDGKGIEQDWRYRYFFQFLQMSPSYWAVHRQRRGERVVTLPADLNVVARVYDDVGDVFNTYFLDWWLKRGRRAFGRTMRPVAVQSLWQGMSGAFDLGSFHQRFDDGWNGSPIGKADVPLLILSVPLAGSKTDTLRQVKEQLAAMEALRLKFDAQSVKYHVLANKMREKTLGDARKVLRARLAQPKWQLWRLGNAVKLAQHYATDPTAKATGNVGHSREMMAIVISRHLHRAHLFAENAARGIFPSLSPTESVDFDIPSQRAWLKGYLKYIEAELHRRKADLAELRGRKAARSAG